MTNTRDRGDRRAHDSKAIARQVRIAKTAGIPLDKVHRFSKVHATTCGDSNCAMCGNPRKFFGEKTIQERKFEEGIDDE